MAINAGTVLAYLDLDTSKFGNAMQLAQQQMTSFAQDGGGVNGMLDGVGAGMTTVGNALTVGVSAPILGAGIAITKWAGDFQESANVVATIADTTVMSMDALNKGVLGISNTTGLAATDINAALYQTISATNDTANALGYTAIAAKAAKGGFTDTATAVDGLSTVMNAYGLKGEEAMMRVSDQMLTAQNYGKTTFGALAGSIGAVIPLAAQLSVGTDELFASIATLTKQGIGTSEAVTGLKAALSGVIKPTSEASEMAASLGLDFSAAALESKGLAGFLADVREKTGGNTEVMAQLFGSVEALNTIMALTSDQGMADMAGGMAAMESSAGATDKAYQTMMEGLNTGTERLTNTFRNYGISLGNIILPIAQKAIAWLQKGVEWLSGLNEGVQKFIVGGIGIAAAIGPALTVGGKLLSAFSPVIPILAAVGGAMALVYSRSERLQAITAKLKTDGLTAFADLKTGVQTYFAQVAAGTERTDALAGAISTAFGDDAGAKINTVIARMAGGMQAAGGVLRGTQNGVGEFFASLIDGQGVAVSLEEGLQAAFGGNVPERVRALQAGVGQFVADLKEDFAQGGVLGVLRGLGNRIADALQSGWEAAMEGAQAVRGHIADGLAIAKDWLAPKAQAWMRNIGEALADAKDYAAQQLPAVREVLANGLALAKDKLTDGAKTAMKWLGEAYRNGSVQRGLGSLTKVGETILEKFTAGKTVIIEKAGELLKGLGDALGSDAAKEKLGDLADIAATIATKIASGAGGWKITAGKLLGDLVAQLTDNGFLATALTGVGKIVTGIAEGIGAAAGGIAVAAEEIITQLLTSITDGGFLTSAFTTAAQVITQIANAIGSAAPGIISAAGTIGVALINGIAGLDWATIFTAAGTVITTIATVLGSVAGNIAGAASDIGIALVNGIASVDWPTIFTAAGDVITTIAGVLGGVASNVAGAASDIGIALINGIAGLDWKTIFTTAGDVVAAIATTIAANATQIATAALDLAKGLLTGLAAVDWAGVSQGLAEACGKLVNAIVDWFSKPDNVKALGDAAASIATGIATGVVNAIDPELININPVEFGLAYHITMYRDDKSGATEWAQGVYADLVSRINAGSATASQEMAGATSLILDGFYGQLSANQPELAEQAAQFNNLFLGAFDMQSIKNTFSQMGFDISDELATALNNGSVQLADVLRGLSLGMNEDMILSMDQNFNMDAWLLSYFGNTSTDVSALLKDSATDWGKVFGQAIPDGATVGLENGMVVLRSKTGEVIKLVSAVDAQATVAAGNKDTAQAGIDAASKALGDGETTVGTAAQGVADALTTPLDALPEESKAQAAAMLVGINAAIAAGTPEAVATIQTAADAVTDKAAEILSGTAGKTIGTDYLGGMETGVRIKATPLRTGMQTAASKAASAAAAILSNGAGNAIGQNVVQGIIGGVGSLAAALASKMRSLAYDAVAAFRNALGMHSPSLVLMGDGGLMAQSIGMGVEKNRDAAIRSMVALARDMHAAWEADPIDPNNMPDNPHNPTTQGGAATGSGFHFYGPITIREEADIQKVSAALAEEFGDQLRGKGY